MELSSKQLQAHEWTLLAKISDRGQIAVAFLIFVEWVEQTCLEWLMATHLHSQEEKRCENKKKGDQCDDRGVYYSFMGPLYAVHPKNSNGEACLVPHHIAEKYSKHLSKGYLYVRGVAWATSGLKRGQFINNITFFAKMRDILGSFPPSKWEGKEKTQQEEELHVELCKTSAL